MSGKVYEVKVVGVQLIAITDESGVMSDDDILDAALDVGGIPRSAMDEAEVTAIAHLGTDHAASVIRHADERDKPSQEGQG